MVGKVGKSNRAILSDDCAVSKNRPRVSLRNQSGDEIQKARSTERDVGKAERNNLDEDCLCCGDQDIQN